MPRDYPAGQIIIPQKSHDFVQDSSKEDVGIPKFAVIGRPNVGKSSFIEAFGLYVLGIGKSVAVLAVDPSSALSGGSILGDKTRMTLLAARPQAFVRPSPAGITRGGVAARTRECVYLCDAAGFDLVSVETIGVGQVELTVSGITDILLLLLLLLLSLQNHWQIYYLEFLNLL